MDTSVKWLAASVVALAAAVLTVGLLWFKSQAHPPHHHGGYTYGTYTYGNGR